MTVSTSSSTTSSIDLVDLDLTAHLAAEGPALIRFCTPSVLPGPRFDVYAADLSISYAPAGSMLDHTGWFAASEQFVAEVQGTDRAFLVPAGSTAANHIVLRAIARAG